MERQPKSQLILALLLCCLLPGLAFAHQTYERLVVFGDSLSDPGNAYYLLGSALTPPYETLNALLIPDAPYAVGGNRFSNGKTWIEQLARSLGLKAYAKAAFMNGTRDHRRGANYAVGAARARDNGVDINLITQVNTYLAQIQRPSREDSLYVVEFGSNDVRDAITALVLDPSGGASGEILTAALTAISDNVLTLYLSGAREFLLVSAADLSLTPAIRKLDLISPGTAMAAAIISTQYNLGLTALAKQLETQLPGIVINHFDIHGGLHEVIGNPDKYQLTNVTDACIMPLIAPYSCSETDNYFFWDGIHPTRSGHAIFSMFAHQVLFPEGLPEKDRRGRHCRGEGADKKACRH